MKTKSKKISTNYQKQIRKLSKIINIWKHIKKSCWTKYRKLFRTKNQKCFPKKKIIKKISTYFHKKYNKNIPYKKITKIQKETQKMSKKYKNISFK